MCVAPIQHGLSPYSTKARPIGASKPVAADRLLLSAILTYKQGHQAHALIRRGLCNSCLLKSNLAGIRTPITAQSLTVPEDVIENNALALISYKTPNPCLYYPYATEYHSLSSCSRAGWPPIRCTEIGIPQKPWCGAKRLPR